MTKKTDGWKFALSLAGVFALVGITYGAAALFGRNIDDGPVRNSTDEIANKVLLASVEFSSDHLDRGWSLSSQSLPSLGGGAILFDDVGQGLISPALNNHYGKYVEIGISSIAGLDQDAPDRIVALAGYESDGYDLARGYLGGIDGPGQYTYQFSFDHVLIDKIAILFEGHATAISIEYIRIYALQ